MAGAGTKGPQTVHGPASPKWRHANEPLRAWRTRRSRQERQDRPFHRRNEQSDPNGFRTSGFVQLPGGNLLLSDYTGRRLLEVDTKGQVVNELRTGPRTIASVDVVQ